MCIRFSVNLRAEIPRRHVTRASHLTKMGPRILCYVRDLKVHVQICTLHPFCGIDYARGKLLRHSQVALTIHNNPGVDVRLKTSGIGVKRYV
jgi:hypothetical protein